MRLLDLIMLNAPIKKPPEPTFGNELGDYLVGQVQAPPDYRLKQMAEMNAMTQNPVGGMIASGLGSAKNWMNNASIPDVVPLLGGTGLGDIIMGEAPELAEDLSYGDRMTRGTGMARQLDPRFADAAFLGMDALGMGAGLKAMGKAGLKKTVGQTEELPAMLRSQSGDGLPFDDPGGDPALMNATQDAFLGAEPSPNLMSRRDFLKNAGLAGAGVAAGATLPDVSRGLMKALPTAQPAAQVAKGAVTAISPSNFSLASYLRRYPELQAIFRKAVQERGDQFSHAGVTAVNDRIDDLTDKAFEGVADAPYYGRLEEIPTSLDENMVLNMLDNGTDSVIFNYKGQYKNPLKQYLFQDDTIDGLAISDLDVYGALWNGINNGEINPNILNSQLKQAISEMKGSSPDTLKILNDIADKPNLLDDVLDNVHQDMEGYGDGVYLWGDN